MEKEFGTNSNIKSSLNYSIIYNENRAPTISVVVPAHNSETVIEEQLRALASQDTKELWELIIVDDCSTDRTIQVIEGLTNLFTCFKLISTEWQGGSARARNIGAQNAVGDLLLFCDADDVVSSNWISSISSFLRANSFSAVGGYIDEKTLNDPLHIQWRPPLMNKGLPIGWWYLPYALTGNLAIKTSDFRSLGGFDETLRNGVDVEFSWRLQLSGLKLGYAPDAVAFVRHREGLIASMRQSYKWGAVSVDLVKRYHQPGSDVPRIMSVWDRTFRLLKNALSAFSNKGSLGAWLRQCSYEVGIAMGYIEFARKKMMDSLRFSKSKKHL